MLHRYEETSGWDFRKKPKPHMSISADAAGVNDSANFPMSSINRTSGIPRSFGLLVVMASRLMLLDTASFRSSSALSLSDKATLSCLLSFSSLLIFFASLVLFLRRALLFLLFFLGC
uniref:Uncharacterized protein n=1 Tax=Proboscia inermis TaxID=420281 RepID=A0A7S0BZK8_9STRA